MLPRRRVLIVAQADDVHALAVRERIVERNGSGSAVIFDTSQFPLNASLSVTEAGTWELRLNDGNVVHSPDLAAVWHRRPQPFRLPETMVDAAARRFARRECAHALDSIYLGPGYRVLNDVFRADQAARKPFQLRVARELGFPVPRTIVTNDVARVRTFQHDLVSDGVVFKTLTSPLNVFGDTRRLLPSHENHFDKIRFAPTIFQAEIRGDDIRVTVVGEDLFAARVERRSPVAREGVDWRLDPTARCEMHRLPDTVSDKLRSLVARLGLEYAAIDLILDSSGDYWFLEVNPEGQFLFVEIDTELPIVDSVARLLLGERETCDTRC